MWQLNAVACARDVTSGFCTDSPYLNLNDKNQLIPAILFFLAKGPAGAEGSANPNGWMQSEDFLKFMKHFVAVTKC